MRLKACYPKVSKITLRDIGASQAKPFWMTMMMMTINMMMLQRGGFSPFASQTSNPRPLPHVHTQAHRHGGP